MYFMFFFLHGTGGTGFLANLPCGNRMPGISVPMMSQTLLLPRSHLGLLL